MVLSALGYRVAGVDGSLGMVEEARRRGVAASVADLATAGPELFGGTAGEKWDGVLSNFGALNCLPTLRGIAAGTAAGLRSGARVILVVMNRRCPVETLTLAMRGRPSRRQDGRVSVGEQAVTVRYLSSRTVVEEFSPAFRVVRIEALGALMSPPDLGGRVGWGTAVEPWVATWPGVRGWGDHTMFVLRRT